MADEDETEAPDAEPPEDESGGPSKDPEPQSGGSEESEPAPDAVDAAAPDAGAAPPDAWAPSSTGANAPADMDAVYDIPVKVSTVLGKTSIQVSELLKLGRGTVVELDRKAGQPVDIYVNNQLVARGELVVVGDRLSINTTEIIKSNFDAS